MSNHIETQQVESLTYNIYCEQQALKMMLVKANEIINPSDVIITAYYAEEVIGAMPKYDFKIIDSENWIDNSKWSLNLFKDAINFYCATVDKVKPIDYTYNHDLEVDGFKRNIQIPQPKYIINK